MTASTSKRILPVQTSHNVPIYNVTGSAHAFSADLPEWNSSHKGNSGSLKKNSQWQQRVQLIQDFTFPTAATKIQFTPDGRHIVAVGTYKPQLRVWDLADMSLKFERHTTSNTTAFACLNESGWDKVALLQEDRTLQFHNSGGVYYGNARIPKTGRDLTYDWNRAELLISASGVEQYRMDLCQGVFLDPITLESEESKPGCNVAAISPCMPNLYAFACDNHGGVQFFDARSLSTGPIAQVHVRGEDEDGTESQDITAFHFMSDGMTWCAGTESGHMGVWDMRRSDPIRTLNHRYGFSVKGACEWRPNATDKDPLLVTWDRKAARVWKNDFSLVTTIEASGGVDINDVAVQDGTGYLVAAVEDPNIQSFFMPSIGSAPRWCSFLENLVSNEESEATVKTGTRASAVMPDDTYGNWRFVTRDELGSLELTHLLGSESVRAYMHGFFVDAKIYEKAFKTRLGQQEDQADSKSSEPASRIKKSTKLEPSSKIGVPKVNAKLAARLMQKTSQTKFDDESGSEEETDAAASSSSRHIITDSRFKAAFEDREFEVEEQPERRSKSSSSGPAKSERPSHNKRLEIPKGRTVPKKGSFKRR